jgi:predicted nucleic acid-binding protein
MAKEVLDTNVLISAILFGGKSRDILEMGISGEFLFESCSKNAIICIKTVTI